MKLSPLWRKWLLLTGVVLVSALVVYWRDPTVFTHAQFWGEDGIYWYGQAYNQGPFRAFFEAYAGSLQTGMRIVGGLSLLLPFRLVPLFFALSAAAIQILPVVLLFTDRFRKLTKSIKVSIVLAVFYLLLPNSFEVHANLTNINWHLALLAIMVVLCPGKSKVWRAFDYVALVVSGLTGPFSIILTPFAFWLRRQKMLPSSYAYVIFATAAAQVVTYLVSPPGSRLSQGLGASPVTFLAIIGSRVTAAFLVSMETVSKYAVSNEIWFAVLGLLTIGFLIYACIKGPMSLKLFVAFAWAVYLVALIKPQASKTVPQWQAMLDGAGNRYFWLPTLSLLVCLVWVVCTGPKVARLLAAAALACSLLIAAPRDFSYLAKPYKNFSDSAVQLDHTNQGKTVCLEVNPSSDWTTCLKKH